MEASRGLAKFGVSDWGSARQSYNRVYAECKRNLAELGMTMKLSVVFCYSLLGVPALATDFEILASARKGHTI